MSFSAALIIIMAHLSCKETMSGKMRLGLVLLCYGYGKILTANGIPKGVRVAVGDSVKFSYEMEKLRKVMKI